MNCGLCSKEVIEETSVSIPKGDRLCLDCAFDIEIQLGYSGEIAIFEEELTRKLAGLSSFGELRKVVIP